jgi:hypothetical protein
MGGKSPKAPDPAKTAAAQGAWDLTTSQSNAITNNANVVNPYGSTNYSISGYETVKDPSGKMIQVPRYTQTQTLSQAGQKQFDDRNALINQLFGKAQSGGTGYGVATLDDNFLRPTEATMATDRARVEQAIMDRANPLLKQNRDSEVARLAAMGLAPGGEKYGRVADQFEKSANDLAIGATMAGGQEQSRLLDLYNKGTAASNDAKTTQTNLNMNARQSLMQELMSMLTGQQPGAQASSGYQGFGMTSPNYAGLAQNKYEADVGAYNNKQQGIASIASTLFGFL